MFDIRGENLIDVFFEDFDTSGVGGVFGIIWDDTLVFCVEEFDYAVDEIAQIVEEFGIVFSDEFTPKKL